MEPTARDVFDLFRSYNGVLVLDDGGPEAVNELKKQVYGDVPKSTTKQEEGRKKLEAALDLQYHFTHYIKQVIEESEKE